MEYSSVPKKTNTNTRTFTLGNLSPNLFEESQNIRPLDVSRDGMRKDGFESFMMFSLHKILVPRFSTTVKKEVLTRDSYSSKEATIRARS